MSPDGKIKARLNDYKVTALDEFPDGTLIFSNHKDLRLVSPDMKLKKSHFFPEATYVSDIGKPNFVGIEERRVGRSYLTLRHLLMTKSGLFLVSFQNKLFFYDSSGVEKASFTAEGSTNSLFVGAAEFPGGEIIVNSSNGYSYFFDKEGKFKFKHHHESKVVTAPVYAGRDLAAYLNKTELVFVDKEGKEKGVLPVDRTIHWDIDTPQMFSPEEGVVIIRDLQLIQFIEL
jgi:outer membrane protein assembly factor BamB